MEEIWKTHKSGYLVSNLGRIKGKTVEFLKLCLQPTGYLVCSEGFVHRVVYETFKGEIPKELVVNHIDGNKQNNRLDNLEAITPSANIKHAYKIGTRKPQKGSDNPSATITEAQVFEIYKDFDNGLTNGQIAEKYHLNSGYVCCMRKGSRQISSFRKYYSNSKPINSSGNSNIPFLQRVEIVNKIINSKEYLTQKEWGAKLGLDPGAISRIRARKIWKDIWEYIDNNRSTPITIQGNFAGFDQHLKYSVKNIWTNRRYSIEGYEQLVNFAYKENISTESLIKTLREDMEDPDSGWKLVKCNGYRAAFKEEYQEFEKITL